MSTQEQVQDKEVTIIVNAQPKTLTAKELSFDQVVALAFPTPSTNPNTIYTVTYRRGQGGKPEGTLAEGQSVKIKEGMIFNVVPSDKS